MIALKWIKQSGKQISVGRDQKLAVEIENRDNNKKQKHIENYCFNLVILLSHL